MNWYQKGALKLGCDDFCCRLSQSTNTALLSSVCRSVNGGYNHENENARADRSLKEFPAEHNRSSQVKNCVFRLLGIHWKRDRLELQGHTSAADAWEHAGIWVSVIGTCTGWKLINILCRQFPIRADSQEERETRYATQAETSWYWVNVMSLSQQIKMSDLRNVFLAQASIKHQTHPDLNTLF